jgi:hypothetical protein
MSSASLLHAALTVSGVRSTIRKGRALAFALVLGLAPPAGSRPAAAAIAGAAFENGREDALWSRLRQIEGAFREGDATALRDSLTPLGKVRLDLPQVPGCPASYGPGQLQVIFSRLFAEGATREFAFRRDEVSLSSDDTAFARARWVRHGEGSRPQPPDTLTFTLRAEGGDWRIHEILAPR